MRVVGHSVAPAELLAEEIWGGSTKESLANADSISTHTVIEETPTKRLYYPTVDAPMVSKRDHILMLERSRDGGVHVVKF